MSGIQVPGQNRGQPNPLLMLAKSVDKTNNHLAEMVGLLGMLVSNTAKPSQHFYGIAPRDESTWGSYCIACSDAVEHYVYPCEVHPDAPRPPSHITILPTITDPTT